MAESTTSQPLEHRVAAWDSTAQTDARPEALARPAWPARSLVLGVVAYSVSLAGTFLLKNESARGIAELLLIGSALLAVVAWGGQGWVRVISPPKLAQPIVVWDWHLGLRLAGLGLAALTIWQANQAYMLEPNETFGLAGWL